MAVGAGSIKRASKISADAVSGAKVEKEQVKTTEKKAAIKKQTAKKTPEKSVTTKEKTAKSTKTDKQVLPNTANKVYHITEELPIYLL